MSTPSIAPRRVLVIAYYFPPMGLSGVQRTLKFVKYLSEFGWHPTVLTVDPRGYFAKDDTLLAELEGRNVTVVRTPASGPAALTGKRDVVEIPAEWKRKLLSRLSDTFFIPDNKIGWRRKAVSRAIALHRETPFDLIFATAPPFTAFLIGRRVKKAINRPHALPQASQHPARAEGPPREQPRGHDEPPGEGTDTPAAPLPDVPRH